MDSRDYDPEVASRLEARFSWDDLPLEDRLDFMFGEPDGREWFSDLALSTFAHYRDNPIVWGRITTTAATLHVSPARLDAAVVAWRDAHPPAVSADAPKTREEILAPEAFPVCHPAAFHGVLGQIVRTLEPEIEADAVGLLVTLLTMVGNAIGRTGPYGLVHATQHYTNLFAVLVGDTAQGRKGTGGDACKKLMHDAGLSWSPQHNLSSGISTGEGLIWHVRDPIPAAGGKGDDDPGVTDKRLCILESEFGRALTKMADKTSIVSQIIREAWDSGSLRSMTSGRQKSPVTATNAHISILGQITNSELRRLLNKEEGANGFGNRFLWVCVRRGKSLPEGGVYPARALEPLLESLRLRLRQSLRAHTMVERTPEAKAIWAALYNGPLDDIAPTFVGAMMSRGAAQVYRLSILYALCDGTTVVTRDHLAAAWAVWRYSQDSLRYLYGETAGDGESDTLLDYIAEGGEQGRSRTEIFKFFKNNMTANAIDAALRPLQLSGHIEAFVAQGGGRPSHRYRTKKVTIEETKKVQTRTNTHDEGGSDCPEDLFSFLLNSQDIHIHTEEKEEEYIYTNKLNILNNIYNTSIHPSTSSTYGDRVSSSGAERNSEESHSVPLLCTEAGCGGRVCRLGVTQGRCARCDHAYGEAS